MSACLVPQFTILGLQCLVHYTVKTATVTNTVRNVLHINKQLVLCSHKRIYVQSTKQNEMPIHTTHSCIFLHHCHYENTKRFWLMCQVSSVYKHLLYTRVNPALNKKGKEQCTGHRNKVKDIGTR